MWKNFKSLSTNLLQCNKYFIEQQRTTYILKRINNVRLNTMREYFPKKIRRREYFYELVEDTNFKKYPDLILVLLKDVPGVGMVGDKIKANPFIAYSDLILPKLAAYENSPEAKNVVRKDGDKKMSSIYSKSVENFFIQQPLPVFLSLDTQWTLQPWHIRVALRRIGIVAHDKCIKLPEKNISGPNLELENRDFIIKIVMNNTEIFPVRCRIYHCNTLDSQNIVDSKKININSEPLFVEQKEEINKLIEANKELMKRIQAIGSSDKLHQYFVKVQ